MVDFGTDGSYHGNTMTVFLDRKWRVATLTVLALWLLLVVTLSGCGGGKQIRFGEQTDRSELFDVVWVEPRIVLSDSLITLLRSERVDTLQADSRTSSQSPAASIDFEVSKYACDVDIDLLDERQNILRPLLVQNLAPGFYRLTFQPERLQEPSLPLGEYFLQVRYCGNRYVRNFVHD